MSRPLSRAARSTDDHGAFDVIKLIAGFGLNGMRVARAGMATLAFALVLVSTLQPMSAARAAPQEQPTFSSPEDAVAAMVGAMRSQLPGMLATIVGPGSEAWLFSGDEVADRAVAEKFVAAYDRRHVIARPEEGRATLAVGDDDWPLPIPLVRSGTQWRFDGTAGREEVLARRIGRNELETIQVLEAMADAQVEYARTDRGGSGRVAYAQKFASSPGRKDGLYWPPQAGEPESPLGPLVAQAAREGYGDAKVRPYRGYVFRMLRGQGAHAEGGAFDYVVKGAMIGGFAIVGYPVAYGVSGVMTFVINQDAVVYQKDLGPATAQAAAKMTRFDPGPGWTKAGSARGP
jgi:hypothetical protein